MNPQGGRESRPIVVDLFAGAGFLSYAFVREGFRVVRAVEGDAVAAATYARNIGPHVEVNDVRRARPSGGADVLVAGPPCQGFSTLGKRDPDDPRNRLCLEVVRWTRVLRPRIAIVENVAAFLGAPIWDRMAAGLARLGYEVSAVVVDAVDFGVPQFRTRSFTFATRSSIPDVTSYVRRERRTVREAWRGLTSEPNGRNWHYAPRPSALALARMKVIGPGGDKRDVMRRAPRLAAPSWWRLGCNVTDVWGRMPWDRPSNTLRTALQNPSKGRYIHPTQHRVISLREAADLQTVPRSWAFEGLPTYIARQIGNGVPVRLGRAVARATLSAL